MTFAGSAKPDRLITTTRTQPTRQAIRGMGEAPIWRTTITDGSATPAPRWRVSDKILWPDHQSIRTRPGGPARSSPDRKIGVRVEREMNERPGGPALTRPVTHFTLCHRASPPGLER